MTFARPILVEGEKEMMEAWNQEWLERFFPRGKNFPQMDLASKCETGYCKTTRVERVQWSTGGCENRQYCLCYWRVRWF